ncbi:MAG: SDR family oxidoreductase [Chloroflexota bacterium]
MTQENKIALVTGSSRGLGKNTALALAQKGVGVIVTYLNNEAAANEVVSEIEGLGSKAAMLHLNSGDISSLPKFAESVKQVLQTVWQRNRFDYLVNNAGIGLHQPFTEVTEADFDLLYNMHVKGVFFLTQKLLPMLNDGGRIVNISSGLTRFSLPGYSTYASAKGAIEVLTSYMAKELGSRQIRVNAVAPGAIETDFGGGAVRDNQDLNNFVASQTALGRVGLPDDIGGAISSLLADENGWITGQRIEISGGMYL